MPTDSAGKFHMNPAHAKASGPPKPKHSAGIEEPGSDANSTTLHDNGDGSFTTSSGGKEEHHPSIGHAVTHIAAKHAPGKHMHAHKGEGGIYTSKSEGGQVDEQEHGDSQSAADEMSQYMGDEGSHGEPMPMSSGHGWMPK
jgi:hypothetical protein